MFKKLSLMLLTVSCSYAMDSLSTNNINNSDIKQNIEEVKQTSEVNNITDKFNDLNINKTVQQLNNINAEGNKANNKDEILDEEKENKNIFFYEPDSDSSIKISNRAYKNTISKQNNKDKIDISNNKIQENLNLKNFNLNMFSQNKKQIKLFDKEKQHCKDFNSNRIIDNSSNKNSTNKNIRNFNSLFDDKVDIDLLAKEDLDTAVMYSGVDNIKELLSCFPDNDRACKIEGYEYNWIKIDTKNQFSQACQEFLQKVIKNHKITEQMMSNFCNSDYFYNCIKMDIEPFSVLEDVYKSNINIGYISKSDTEFLDGQIRHLSRFVPARTKKIKQHWYSMASLQEQLHISDIEASQVYWDSYWSNYSLHNK